MLPKTIDNLLRLDYNNLELLELELLKHSTLKRRKNAMKSTGSNKSIDQLREEFPSLSLLDLHYFSMKCYGIKDPQITEGRPSINLIDEEGLYHITFTTNEQNSPYSFENEMILHNGENLPFRVVYVERIPVRVRRYYYLRSSRYMTPSLGDEKILNLNLHHQCYYCGFCQNLVCGSQSSLTPDEGFEFIMSRGDIATLEDMAEVAIVTGSFDSEQGAFDHVSSVIDNTLRYGFRGRIFYMGHELSSPEMVGKLKDRVNQEGLAGLKIAYTVEMFANRQKLMGGCKGEGDIESIASKLKDLSQLGLYELQYSYMPGLDNLEDFRKGATRLFPYATPHLSIYRPFLSEQREKHISQDYKTMGVAYLCEVRSYYQDLYGGPLIGNNLGNMFAFPVKNVSDRWINGTITGKIQHMRYWANEERPIGWRIVH